MVIQLLVTFSYQSYLSEKLRNLDARETGACKPGHSDFLNK